MAGNWRKQVSKAAISEDREHVLKLLQESAEPETVRNLCVPLFGRHKYHKKWKSPVTFEDAVVEGSMSLLDIAAANGWVDVCEELVTKHGCMHETSTVTDILEPASSYLYENKGRYLQCSPLSYAVKEGHVDVVAYLVRVFKLLIRDDDEGRAFLAFAIINSRLEMVKYFVSVCEIDASKLSRLAGVALLVGGFSKCGESYPVSPFIIACIQCCDDIIKYLVTEGHCDPREECNWTCGRYKVSPVIAVAFKGNVEVVKYVLDLCDVYLFEREVWDLFSLVPRTCMLGDSEVIRFLIRQANIKDCMRSDAHQLLMMSSVSSGLIDCVQYMHVNNNTWERFFLNMYGMHRVDEATLNGHFDVVKYLLQHEQVSPSTMYAAASSGHLRLIEYLMENHLMQEFSDITQFTRKCHRDRQRVVVQFAAGCGHLGVVKDLIANYNLTLNESESFIEETTFLSLKTFATSDRIPSSDGGILHIAAERGHLNIVEYLIDTWNHDPKKTNKFSQTPLHFAAFNGHLPVVEHLLRTSSHVPHDDDGNTPLHFACWQGHLRIVKCLIEQHKHDPTMTNRLSQSPICLAVQGGHLPVVEYLAGKVPSVDPEASMDYNGNTVLHLAAYSGHINMVEYVINNWVSYPYKSNKHSQTPLHVAFSAVYGHVAEYLIKEFPGVVTCTDASVDEWGNTALHIAVEHGSLSIIKYLTNECKLNPYKKTGLSETPLYFAVYNGHLPVIKCLFSECPSVIPEAPVDRKGNTALHIGAEHGSLSTIKYLIKECKLNPNKTNLKSHTPLHVACSFGKMDVAEYLIKEFPGVVTCADTPVDWNVGDTALHSAVEHGSLTTIKYLIQECKLNPYKKNKFFQTPLYLAVYNGHLPVVQYLFSECPSVIPEAPVDGKGNTALHIAAKHGSLSTIKYLIKECKLNPNKTNVKSHTPLHVACSFGKMDVAEYLIKEFPGVVTCADTPVDWRGNTALHIAVKHGSLSTIKYLTNECKLNPYKKNTLSETPLYLAVRNGHLPVVKCLFSECSRVIPEAPVDDKGNTALHIAAKYGRVNVVRYLTKACELDPNQPNQVLSTSLHLSIAHNHLPVVRFLLDEGLCHASDLKYHKCLSSANRETSLVLVTEYDVKCYLSSFGSPSTFYENVKFVRDIKSSFPVHSFTKVFLLGDPAAGKSTLAKNFRDLASRFLPSFFGQVSGVEYHTAGIIPVTIQSRQLGNVVLYDLAGHPEFYSSHMAVLHKLMQECPAVFICVIDLSKSVEEVRKELRFWFNFIRMGSAVDSVRADSQVVVAGSHADLLSNDDYSQKQRLVETISRKSLVESFAGLAALDCRKVSSAGLASLIRLILQAQETIRDKVRSAKGSIPIFCHMLMGFLHKLKGRDNKSNVYSLTDLSQLICKENLRIDRHWDLVSIPSDVNELHHFLSILNDRGLVLYLRGSTDEDSWIVVDEEALLSKVSGVLFAPEGFKEHRCIASNTGIATSSHITGLFPNIPPQVVIGMLKSLEFCKEIDPSHLRVSNLSLKHSQGEFSLHEGENLLFFPSHISTERPNKVWKLFRFCWYLVCQDPHQFSMHFLQVLLLRLAVSFTKHCRVSWQIDEHLCTVWKNGIRWVNENGIETVVEVLERCTIVQLVITCPKGMMVEHCRHRSTLIREILALKQELCPSIELQEMFVLPECLQDLKYPLPPLSELSLLNIKSVAQCAVQNRICSTFVDSFDPYRNLGESLIRSLFTKGDSKVSELDLFQIAEWFRLDFQTHEHGCDVLGISPRELENRLSELPSGERENPVRVCEELFLKWQAHDSNGGTYESLKRRFDMFSVFAGRNPLDLAEIEQPSLPVPLCESHQNSQSCKQ